MNRINETTHKNTKNKPISTIQIAKIIIIIMVMCVLIDIESQSHIPMGPDGDDDYTCVRII